MCRGGRLFHKITRSQVDPDSLEINNNGVKKPFCSILNNIFLKLVLYSNQQMIYEHNFFNLSI